MDSLRVQAELGSAMTAQTLLGVSGGSQAIPAGYAASAGIQFNQAEIDRAVLAKLAGALLQDPLAMQQLSDRVYDLMQAHLRIQQERNHSYGRRF